MNIFVYDQWPAVVVSDPEYVLLHALDYTEWAF